VTAAIENRKYPRIFHVNWLGWRSNVQRVEFAVALGAGL
jgi:hypothetical protein